MNVRIAQESAEFRASVVAGLIHSRDNLGRTPLSLANDKTIYHREETEGTFLDVCHSPFTFSKIRLEALSMLRTLVLSSLVLSVVLPPLLVQKTFAVPIIQIENDFGPAPISKMEAVKVVLVSLHTQEESLAHGGAWLKDACIAKAQLPQSRGKIVQYEMDSAFGLVDVIYVDLGNMSAVYPLNGTYQVSPPAILNKVIVTVTQEGGPGNFGFSLTVIPEERGKKIQVLQIPDLDNAVYRATEAIPQAGEPLSESSLESSE
jgi:hypothetical protein